MGSHGRNLLVHVLFIVIVIGTQATCQAAASDDKENPVDVYKAFEEWMVVHNRVYESKQEKEKRFAIFKTTFEHVENYMKHRKPNSFTLGLNDLSDKTLDEVPTGYIPIKESADLLAKGSITYRHGHRRRRAGVRKLLNPSI